MGDPGALEDAGCAGTLGGEGGLQAARVGRPLDRRPAPAGPRCRRSPSSGRVIGTRAPEQPGDGRCHGRDDDVPQENSRGSPQHHDGEDEGDAEAGDGQVGAQAPRLAGAERARGPDVEPGDAAHGRLDEVVAGDAGEPLHGPHEDVLVDPVQAPAAQPEGGDRAQSECRIGRNRVP